MKDVYCVGYFGPKDYISRLLSLRPSIEAKFPGLKLILACKDGMFMDVEGIIHESELRNRRHEIGYFRELVDDFVNDPVDMLLKEI